MAKEIILTLSEHDKRVLGTVEIIRKVKNQLCSLDSVDRDKDFNDQVEGRLLFKDFADELIEHLTHEVRISKPLDRDEYE